MNQPLPTEAKPFRILVSAFNFSPVKGSEFATGWDFVRAIAKHSQVWVITRSMEREEVESYMREHPEILPGVKVLYVPWKFNNYRIPLWELLYYWHLRKWNRYAFDLAFCLDQAINFDVIHHVTGTGFRSVGHLWQLGKPFVWGPVAGMLYFPVRMLDAVPLRNRPYFLAKNLATYIQMRSPRLKKIAQSAALVIAGTTGAAEQIKALWGVDAPVMQSCNAPDVDEILQGLPRSK